MRAGTNTHDREDDAKWPTKNKDGKQELEIKLGNEHISFEVRHQEATAASSIPLLTRCADRQDRLDQRRYRLRRSGWATSILLPGPGSEGTSLQPDRATLQDQAHLIFRGWNTGRLFIILEPWGWVLS